MKPSIPKGTRDFSPLQMNRRNYIFDTIKSVFQLYGYQVIETPAMENLSTLMGKYGEEGDKLLFKILNSGDWRSALDNTGDLSLGQATNKVAEKGLRYDLTVPFARYVVQHRAEIVFPFKRYQIQPVWRADRPQHGRYREFFQCDVDIIGTRSLLAEVELLQIIAEVYKRLNIAVEVHINNRKVLAGIAQYIGFPDKMVDLTVAIDKFEKIGKEAVEEELRQKGLTQEAIDLLQPIWQLEGSTEQKLTKLADLLKNTDEGLKGVAELQQLFQLCEGCGVDKTNLLLDLTLARGLNYYTGAIFEVKTTEIPMGSITGGGRYDNLTGIFGLPDVSGVGISFGADRIYDVLTELNRFPENIAQNTDVLFVCFGEKESQYAMQCAKMMRQNGIKTEVFLDQSKIKKQMAYANERGIPYVAIIGEEEMASEVILLKNMLSGEQKQFAKAELEHFTLR